MMMVPIHFLFSPQNTCISSDVLSFHLPCEMETGWTLSDADTLILNFQPLHLWKIFLLYKSLYIQYFVSSTHENQSKLQDFIIMNSIQVFLLIIWEILMVSLRIIELLSALEWLLNSAVRESDVHGNTKVPLSQHLEF